MSDSLRFLSSNVLRASQSFLGLTDIYKRHQKLYFNHQKTVLRANFTRLCVEEKLVPNFLRCRLPKQLKNHHHLLRTGQLKTLKKVHQDNEREVDAAKEKIHQYEALITEEVSSYQMKMLQQLSASSSARPLSTIKERQEKKMKDLRAHAASPEISQGDHVYNLSDRPLNYEEMEALRYGMKT